VAVSLRDAQGRKRDVVVTPVVMDPWLGRETRPAQGTEIAPGIAYFDLCGADKKALETALPRLSQARAVILDMRGYPGRAGIEVLRHLASQPITSAHWNVPRIFWPNRQGLTFETSGRWNVEPATPHLPAPDGKIVFMTDGRAISYAESCMGIVEAYHLGAIVGDATAGTNGNVAVIRLPGGFSIGFTAMQVIKHDGTPHHGVGIRPTVPATRTIRGIADGRDEVLEKAITAAGG
jgi:C-terminal processing protease CtpA/Prc